MTKAYHVWFARGIVVTSAFLAEAASIHLPDYRA